MSIKILTRSVDINRPPEEEAASRLLWREVGRLGPEEIRAEFFRTFTGLAKAWDTALAEEAAEEAA